MERQHYNPRASLRLMLASAGVTVALVAAPQVSFAEELSAPPAGDSVLQSAVDENPEVVDGDQRLVEDKEGVSTDVVLPDEGGKTDVPSTEPDASDVIDAPNGPDAQPGHTTPPQPENSDVDVKTEDEAAPSIPEKTVDNGSYVIQSAANNKQVVDVYAGGTSNGSNVQSYQSNMTSAQKWTLEYNEVTGYYTIINTGSGKVLDVTAGTAKPGTNVQIYSRNDSYAQQWKIEKVGGSYIIISRLSDNLVLAMSTSNVQSGVNICIKARNDNDASQLFNFLTTNIVVGPGVTLDKGDGAYYIGTSNSSIKVEGSGSTVKLGSQSGSSNQKIYFKSDGKGYYTLISEGTGKAFEAQNGSIVSGMPVVLSGVNLNKDAQKWALIKNTDGSYTLKNKANGLVLDIYAGLIRNGAVLQTYASNGSSAQKFWFTWLNTAITGDKYEEYKGTGDFAIGSGTSDSQVVDVYAGSKANGGNVQTWGSNMTGAQKWKFTRDNSAGYYTITNVGSGKVLDIYAGSYADGSNVDQYAYNGTDAQKWKIYKSGDRYIIVSALRNDLVLDLYAGGTANGTNAQVYTYNGTAAQKFYLMSYSPNIAVGNTVLADGAYTIGAFGNKGYVVDIAAGSTANNANAQIYQSNGSSAQRFYITRDSQGYYTIAVVGTGKVLDVQGGAITPGANVRQWESNGKDSQKWVLIKNDDGSYSFMSKANGYVLNIYSGKLANGSNLQVYRQNGSAAQKFWLTGTSVVSDGIYQISGMKDPSKVLDVKGGATTSGTGLQMTSSNGSLAQRFQIIVGKDGTLQLRTAASGGWVTGSGSSVTQEGSSKTQATGSNTWKIVTNGVFFSLQLADGTGRVLGSNGSVVSLGSMTSNGSQYFLFNPAQLIANGYYEIISKYGTVIDIPAGSTANGVLTQTYGKNGSNAQKYRVYVSNGKYIIKNINSGKVLDVKNASGADGASVQQWQLNGHAAQQWIAEIADGGYVVFRNVNSGKVLSLASGSAANGVKIVQSTANGGDAQLWKLEKTTVYGWINEDGTWMFYYKNGKSQAFVESTKIAYDRWMASYTQSSGTYGHQYSVIVDQKRFYTNIMKRNSDGQWEPLYGWLCGTGAGGRTGNGVYEITGRHDYTEGTDQWGRQYYYTEFLYYKQNELGQCFHSLVYRNGQLYEDGRGSKVSAGCVRLTTEQAKWIYDTLPAGTFVWIYEY